VGARHRLPRFAPDRYPVFATVDLPLRDFLADERDPDLAAVVALSLVFDRAPTGMLVVRAVSLVPDGPAPP
jgi:hypothetical protein